jgi:hypothetical protein
MEMRGVIIVRAEFRQYLKERGHVAGCRAVGNVLSEAGSLDLDTELRNKTLGFGGNVLFVTRKLGPANEGVAYRCN